jgi:hypothetical protein
LEKVTNEIVAFIPAIFDRTIKIFIPPNDTLQFKLFKMVYEIIFMNLKKIVFEI